MNKDLNKIVDTDISRKMEVLDRLNKGCWNCGSKIRVLDGSCQVIKYKDGYPFWYKVSCTSSVCSSDNGWVNMNIYDSLKKEGKIW